MTGLSANSSRALGRENRAKIKPGHQRHRKDAGEQLHGGDEMSVMGLRMHVAVAGGRQRLDPEIEIVDIGAARHVRDRLIRDPVEQREDRVEGNKHQCGAGDERRPGGRHAAMADVGPETEMLAFRDDDLAASKPDDPRLRCSLALAV